DRRAGREGGCRAEGREPHGRQNAQEQDPFRHRSISFLRQVAGRPSGDRDGAGPRCCAARAPIEPGAGASTAPDLPIANRTSVRCRTTLLLCYTSCFGSPATFTTCLPWPGVACTVIVRGRRDPEP